MVPWQSLDVLEGARRLVDDRCDHLGVVSHGPLPPPPIPPSSSALPSVRIVKVAALFLNKLLRNFKVHVVS